MSDTRRPENKPIDVWMVTDGKAGHENQSRALIDRLGTRADVRAHRILAPRNPLWPPGRSLWGAHAELPDPELILCAGRRTHRTALAVKRRRGGVLVVCMRPYVAQRHFDLCFIPAHDEPEHAPNVEITTGAIVNVRPSAHHDKSRGVILIGGPSAHFGMDPEALADRIRVILESSAETQWDLATSRRTTAEATDALMTLRRDRMTVWTNDQTPPGWVGERLAESGVAWITEDSASMLCESVTAGSATGVLPMIRKNPEGRVARGVDDLRARGLVTMYHDWIETGELRAPAEPLDEADRCARLIMRRFFPDRGDAS